MHYFPYIQKDSQKLTHDSRSVLAAKQWGFIKSSDFSAWLWSDIQYREYEVILQQCIPY